VIITLHIKPVEEKKNWRNQFRRQSPIFAVTWFWRCVSWHISEL